MISYISKLINPDSPLMSFIKQFIHDFDIDIHDNKQLKKIIKKQKLLQNKNKKKESNF
jgi:hypothetical protein